MLSSCKTKKKQNTYSRWFTHSTQQQLTVQQSAARARVQQKFHELTFQPADTTWKKTLKHRKTSSSADMFDGQQLFSHAEARTVVALGSDVVVLAKVVDKVVSVVVKLLEVVVVLDVAWRGKKSRTPFEETAVEEQGNSCALAWSVGTSVSSI